MRSADELEAMLTSDPLLRAVAERAAALYDEADPGHDKAHHRRVALWAWRIADDEVDTQQLLIAALLHDVVNIPKTSSERAMASSKSADVAAGVLDELGLSDHVIGKITSAIRTHSYSRGERPEGPMGDAICDADRLEAIGAIGLMRTFATGARMGARFFEPSDPWARERELDDRSFTIDHFFTKLLTLPDTMYTERGRAEAKRRLEIMRAFLTQLGRELGDEFDPKIARAPGEAISGHER